MESSTLLLARWISVVVGGLFSYSMIRLVVNNQLQFYLADSKFEILVLLGGVLLAIVVLLRLRGLTIGRSFHQHDHDHDHAHDHSHDEAQGEAHTHEHGGVSLWRFVVLAIPLMMLLMGLVPRGLSAEATLNRMTRGQREAIAAVKVVGLPAGRSAGGEIQDTDARELQAAASQGSIRAFWESKDKPVRARLSGQFQPDPRFQDRYRLTRIKITCCAADATPMVVTVAGPVDPSWRPEQWLEITGPVSFVEVPDPKTGANQYFPMVHQQAWSPTDQKPYIQ